MTAAARRSLPAALLLSLLVPEAALAHEGQAMTGGLAAGFLHPLTGLDHLAALLLLGFLAGRHGGRARVRLPAVTLAALAAGAAAGALAGSWTLLPGATEVMLALSLLAVGLLVAVTLPVGALAALGLAALFAFFHGTAHGLELAAGPAFAGFLAASLLLLIAGSLLADIAHGLPRVRQSLGGGAAALGLALLLL